MDLFVAAILLAILGILAQAFGSDSRDADSRLSRPSW